MEKQKVQSRLRVINVLIILSFFSNICLASNEDSLSVNNNFFFIKSIDTINLTNCVYNFISVSKKYVLKSRNKAIDLTFNKKSKQYEVSINSYDSSVNFILRKRFSFKKKKIFITLIPPPKPRISIGALHIVKETNNLSDLRPLENFLTLKTPWDYEDLNTILYRVSSFNVSYNGSDVISVLANKFDVKDNSELLEISNILYQVGTCKNNFLDKKIIFE